MEVKLYKSSDHPQLARLNKGNFFWGIAILFARQNPKINTRMYEVQFSDGETQALSENNTAKNIFAQVKQEGIFHKMLN